MNTLHLKLQSVAATLVALFLCLNAYAVLPPTLNYQGHLTDSSGIPIDGPMNMTFAIYDIETGGTALWSDTRSVTIDQGVFSVELGGGLNPFPLGLYENPLWMGLTVDTDAEMSPRRSISSTAFSFKAEDANTLEGVSVSTLDQSLHVIDTANPHNVTAAQAGAADAATLSAHTGNASNPHSVTAAQTGAATSSSFTTHTGDISAHHPRYTGAEAVSAMGVISDLNPLHHNKYTDNDSVTAMLANDGAGSTLDADLLDGLQASEVIDAAQDEVRTPISSLPYSISQPGSYYLTGNLDGSTGGIDIVVDNVTIDLMGFTIDGGGSILDYGINIIDYSNAAIYNGTISGFGLTGIFQSGFGRNAIVTNLQVLNNGSLGTSADQLGIFLEGDNNHVERCNIRGNGGGIYVGPSSLVINNRVSENGGDVAIYGGDGTIIEKNSVYKNTSQTTLIGTYGSSIINNNVSNNTGSFIISAFDGSKIINNNVTYNASTYTIAPSAGSTVINNNVAHNEGTYAVIALSGVSIVNNTVTNNDNWGVYAANGNLIKDNNISNNNTTNTAQQGGLRILGNNRVIGNTLDANLINNIYVGATGNSIEENLFTNSTNGLSFVTDQNFFVNNRAHGNTTNYVNSSVNTDGGGNFEY